MEFLNNVTDAAWALRYVFIVLVFLGLVGLTRHVIAERDEARAEARRAYFKVAELREDNQRLRRLLGTRKRGASNGAPVVTGPVVQR